jgi:hypothetical protein
MLNDDFHRHNAINRCPKITHTVTLYHLGLAFVYLADHHSLEPQEGGEDNMNLSPGELGVTIIFLFLLAVSTVFFFLSRGKRAGR